MIQLARRAVSLVCLPWHMIESPSIQIGTLHAALERAGLGVRSHSFHLAFQEFLEEHRRPGRELLTLEDYADVSTRWSNLGAGEWIFAVPPARELSAARDAELVSLMRSGGVPPRVVRRLKRARELVPRFLERCVDEILAGEPALVGFTCVYAQTLPALALAAALKARAPAVKVVLGGASCEGPMGKALMRAAPCVDAVVRGEAETRIVELAKGLLGEGELPALPGVCLREGERLVESVPEGERVVMDDVPIPDYAEYFERLERGNLATRILPQVPFESSRGCWWGAKSHCTFCGLNGTSMAFRSKSPERVFDEVSTLAERHGALDFTAVDNILDLAYLDTLVPRLASRGLDLSFFYETKANLSEPRVAALRSAGVTTLQPGLESLSTPILAHMKKGVTALQNVRLLRDAARHGIHVIWNLIYGFPGEPREEYERMARLVPALAHLDAPALVRLMVCRFSPYHERPSDHGLVLRGPLAFYRHLYDTDDATLRDLAQAFEFAYDDGRDPERYVGPLREVVERWARDAPRNRGALTYRAGPGFLVLTDTRTTSPAPARYRLDGAEAVAYLACEGGASRRAVRQAVEERAPGRLGEAALEALLDELLDARILIEADGKLLGLALPHRARG